MADRTSAGIFSDIFVAAAQSKSPSVRRFAKDVIWKMTESYDFHPCQMECDEYLANLGLATEHEDGEFTYGEYK